MLLSVKTVAAEVVDVSMAEVTAEDVEEEADKGEEDFSKQIVEEAEENIKMELTSQMSPVTF